jgi:protein PhnA
MRFSLAMSDISCPICTVDDVVTHSDKYECMTCGHEWAREAVEEEDVDEVRVVKDAYGNVLEAGDIVQMIKDLKLKGTSKVLKSGMKSKPIRIVDGDHEIDCKMDGLSIALKAQFVKKVQS